MNEETTKPGGVLRRLGQASRGELSDADRQALADEFRERGRRSRIWARRELALLTIVFGLVGAFLLAIGVFGKGHPSARAYAVAVLFTVGGMLGATSLIVRGLRAKQWLTALGIAAAICGCVTIAFVH